MSLCDYIYLYDMILKQLKNCQQLASTITSHAPFPPCRQPSEQEHRPLNRTAGPTTPFGLKRTNQLPQTLVTSYLYS